MSHRRRAANPELRRQDDAKRLAHLYFKWLRERVLEHRARLPHTALDYKAIPPRVAVPALAPAAELDAHPGTGYRVGPGRVLGGDADRPAVQAALDEFVGRLRAETGAFCEKLPGPRCRN